MVTRRPAKSSGKPQPKRAGPLALAGECGLSQLEILKSRLDAVLACAAPVTLDATRMTGIDTAGLQLLAAFVRERQAKGHAVAWRGVPAWFTEMTQQLGLAATLALASA